MNFLSSAAQTITAALSRAAVHGSSSITSQLQPSVCNSVLLLLQQQRLQHTSSHAHSIEQQLADQLSAAVGGKAAVSSAVLQQHGVDEGYAAPMPPDIVLFPQSTQQVCSMFNKLNVVYLSMLSAQHTLSPILSTSVLPEICIGRAPLAISPAVNAACV
jgi:hypothetical protein